MQMSCLRNSEIEIIDEIALKKKSEIGTVFTRAGKAKEYFQQGAPPCSRSRMRGPLRMRMRQLGVARVVVLLTSFLSAGPRFDRIALGVCGAC